MIVLAVGYLVMGIPLVTNDWGLVNMVDFSTGKARDYSVAIFREGVAHEPPWIQFLRVVGGYTWGYRLIGFIYLTFLAVLFISDRKRIRTSNWLALAALGSALLFVIVMHWLSPSQFAMRHYASSFPLVLILIGWSATSLRDRMSSAFINIGFAAVATLIALVLPNVLAAHLCTLTDGNPPFQRIADWADESFHPGTPILCDRSYTAWNEFALNSPKHTEFVGTVPNEPPSKYEANAWRETAKSFCETNTDAAFFESHHYWQRLGPFDWPKEFFASSMSFQDEPSLRLQEMGLLYRGWRKSYPEDWRQVTVYYNSDADLVEKARKNGDVAFAMFGKNFQCVKTKDGRDWRRVRDQSVIRLHNLGSTPINANLRIEGRCFGERAEYETTLGESWTFGDENNAWIKGLKNIPPGWSDVILRGENAKSILLVRRLQISDIETAD